MTERSDAPLGVVKVHPLQVVACIRQVFHLIPTAIQDSVADALRYIEEHEAAKASETYAMRDTVLDWAIPKVTFEAAQQLRALKNVPVAQTGERSQQGNGSEVAPSTRPQVAEVAGATPAGNSPTPNCVAVDFKPDETTVNLLHENADLRQRLERTEAQLRSCQGEYGH